MARLIYQIKDQLRFDKKTLYNWADQPGIKDPLPADDVKIEWIDKSGLIHIS